MHERFLAELRWRGVRVISGLLSNAPAIALQLDDFAEEFYSDDMTGTPIEAVSYTHLDVYKRQALASASNH